MRKRLGWGTFSATAAYDSQIAGYRLVILAQQGQIQHITEKQLRF